MHDDSRLLLTAQIFASADDIVAFEKSKHKNLYYADIQKIKKDAADTWAFLTSACAVPAVVVHAEAATRRPWSYGFSLVNGIMTAKPVFSAPVESASYAIPADVTGDAARQRMDALTRRLEEDPFGRFNATDEKRAVDLAVLYAEAQYYAMAAHAADQDDLPIKEQADEAAQFLADDLMLNYAQGAVGLETALGKSFQRIKHKKYFH